MLQGMGAKSRQTGELLNTSLALREHVPVALGFSFSECIKKILRESDLPVTSVPLCTGGVDLIT